MDMKLSSILFSILILVCTTLVVKFLNWVWIRPKRLEKLLRRQGLNGNPYRLLVGDMKDFVRITKAEQPKTIEYSDDLVPHILPYYHQTIKKYGKNSFVWFGPSPRLNIADPDLIKEILMDPAVFQKPSSNPLGEVIVGGLYFFEGEKWAKHRKLINPAFHVDKLKTMTSAMCLSCSEMLKKWKALENSSYEIDVLPDLEILSGDVISRTAFGSNHEQGRTIFELQKEQLNLVIQLIQYSFIPGFRYIPTKANKRMKVISAEIKSSLTAIIKKREYAMQKGEAMANDLLGLLMQSNIKEIEEQNGKKNVGMSMEDLIEECKLFYIAGSDTISVLLTWTMVLLGRHQQWQARARDEVLQVFGKSKPTFDGLNQLKIVTMILNEVLRLYTPTPQVFRAPTKTVKLGSMTLPAGVELTILLGALHLDPNVWGNDANEFKPERFSEGIASASKTQFSFIPFSGGPRYCVGQNFAMAEVKIALVMILQSFSFELSPSYLHTPFPIFTLQPQFGLPLILHEY